MILSDREIKAALARGALKLTPDPPTEAWSSTAVDLRLAKELVLWKRPGGAGVEAVVCPAHPEYNFDAVRNQYSQSFDIPADGYVFKSQTFLLGWTQEKVQLPHRSRLAARVEGKSSLARLGIGVHVTAPTIHAGFGYKKGEDNYPGSPLQLEMWNVGPLDVKLVAGMPICQLIFELVDGTPEKGYEGKFSIQGLTRSAWLQNGVVVVVMFLMALPLGFRAFLQSFRQPLPAALAVTMNSVVVPLLAWGAAILLAMMARDAVVGRELAVGLLVAGATPCTLASAAVWTRRAGGNEAVAVLGTIFTNLGCFVVMPFWLLTTTGQTIERPFGDMALKLLLLIVTPTLAAQGLRLHRPLGHWATKHKVSLSTAAQFGILFTVLTGAISAGLKLEGDAWRLLGWETGSMIVAVMSVHLLALFSGLGVALALRQTRADAIAVGIAGSQKTLMVGLTIAYTYFGGLAVLPIIVYHCGQLLADTLIADWLRQRGLKRDSGSKVG